MMILRTFLFICLLWTPAITQAPPPGVIIRTQSEELYRTLSDGSLQRLDIPLDGHRVDRLAGNRLLLDGGDYVLDLTAAQPTVEPSTSQNPEVDFDPLFGPQAIDIPISGFKLVLMSSETHPYVNLYAVSSGGEVQQLTDVTAAFPDVPRPILSASVDPISKRPGTRAILYRARLRDAEGTDHNALYLYDFQADKSLPMPYFGKNPTWSPNGAALVGARLEEQNKVPPLYRLWLVNLQTAHETALDYGCNPAWSPNGRWIAYNGHTNSQWQGYTDCFASGEVFAWERSSGTIHLLSAEIQEDATLLGWLP